MKYFPLAIRLKSRPVLVVGGGVVAQRKIENFLKAGARITVVSPQLTPVLLRQAQLGRIRWKEGRVQKNDLIGRLLIVSATADSLVNRKVSGWARELGILVNVVDQSPLSDFISSAIIRQDKVLVSVYTDGRDPSLSRDLKNFLKEQWDAFVLYRHRLSKRAA